MFLHLRILSGIFVQVYTIKISKHLNYDVISPLGPSHSLTVTE